MVHGKHLQRRPSLPAGHYVSLPRMQCHHTSVRPIPYSSTIIMTTTSHREREKSSTHTIDYTAYELYTKPLIDART
jgi:hypothetical protein